MAKPGWIREDMVVVVVVGDGKCKAPYVSQVSRADSMVLRLVLGAL
jgi:hypothetical protein